MKDLEGLVKMRTHFGEIIENTLGQFRILKNNVFTQKDFNKDILIKLNRRDKVIDAYRSRIQIATIDKNSSVLTLSLIDVSMHKAEDVLNELVKQYNIDAIKDKNLVSTKTKVFIEERLFGVGNDLALIQDNVKDYKTKYGITGLSAEGELALEAVSLNNKQDSYA